MCITEVRDIYISMPIKIPHQPDRREAGSMSHLSFVRHCAHDVISGNEHPLSDFLSWPTAGEKYRPSPARWPASRRTINLPGGWWHSVHSFWAAFCQDVIDQGPGSPDLQRIGGHQATCER